MNKLTEKGYQKEDKYNEEAIQEIAGQYHKILTAIGENPNREGLLKYLVSFRNHNEFHEQCIERIFVDIMKLCKPEKLTVYGRYTRRGGLDINPFRTT